MKFGWFDAHALEDGVDLELHRVGDRQLRGEPVRKQHHSGHLLCLQRYFDLLQVILNEPLQIPFLLLLLFDFRIDILQVSDHLFFPLLLLLRPHKYLL